MKATLFHKNLEHPRIVKAIRAAEKKTSGEIRVFITRKEIKDPISEAQSHFIEMGMNKTHERNGVLFFIAPMSHKFAVVGDTAIHARCGEAFWKQLADEISGHFRKSQFTEGIIRGIEIAGDLLAVHFPCRSDDRNELSDQVEGD